MLRNKNREEILTEAIRLFSAAGYAGVSMRDIARACHLNVGSLYHHFSDKQHLHLAAMQQAFAGRSDKLLEVLEGSAPAQDRLIQLIEVLCLLVSTDQTFSRLVQWELLDGDEIRLKNLAEQVFEKFSLAFRQLCLQLNPQLDPALLAHSILGMVLHLFQSAPLRKCLAGFQAEHEQPEFISRHLQQLLLQGLNQPLSARGSA
jgi:TetR/AcrR family transcriptional regulator